MVCDSEAQPSLAQLVEGGAQCPAQDAVHQLQRCKQTVAPQAAISTWGCPWRRPGFVWMWGMCRCRWLEV